MCHCQIWLLELGNCRDPFVGSPAICSGSLGGVRHYYRRVRIPRRTPGVLGRFHWGIWAIWGRSEVYQLLRVWHVGQGSQICSPSKFPWNASCSQQCIIILKYFPYPLVIEHSYWKWPFIGDFAIKKWWFSIAMLVHQRVSPWSFHAFDILILGQQWAPPEFGWAVD